MVVIKCFRINLVEGELNRGRVSLKGLAEHSLPG
jgi:hypothetical protein